MWRDGLRPVPRNNGTPQRASLHGFEFRRTGCVKPYAMKKSILVTTLVLLGIAGFGASAEAYERREDPRSRDQYRERNRDYRDSDLRQLRAELYQLDILFSRANAQMRYGIGRQSRWEYSRLLRDRERLNYELSRRPLDRLRIHAQIDRIRDRLREIEVRLRVHPHRFYR